jgi:hypothetical protein
MDTGARAFLRKMLTKPHMESAVKNSKGTHMNRSFKAASARA